MYINYIHCESSNVNVHDAASLKNKLTCMECRYIKIHLYTCYMYVSASKSFLCVQNIENKIVKHLQTTTNAFFISRYRLVTQYKYMYKITEIKFILFISRVKGKSSLNQTGNKTMLSISRTFLVNK